MQKIKPLGIPTIEYAQIFSIPQSNVDATRHGQFMISYVSEGKFELTAGGNPTSKGKEIRRSIYDVFCSCVGFDREEHFEFFHEHHAVCFSMDFQVVDEGDEGICLPERLEYGAPYEVHRLIDEIIRIYSHFPERKYHLAGLVLQLLDEIDRQALPNVSEKNRNESLYEYKAIKYIYENVDKPITQRDIARHLGITPEYFSAVFKNAKGISPKQFVNRVKLSSIRMLMAKENLKLYEAAQRYGFTDANYVSKLFKKYYGINITQSLTKQSEK